MPQSPTSYRPMTSLEWVMLLTLAIVWGGSFFFNGIAIRELPVLGRGRVPRGPGCDHPAWSSCACAASECRATGGSGWLSFVWAC